MGSRPSGPHRTHAAVPVELGATRSRPGEGSEDRHRAYHGRARQTPGPPTRRPTTCTLKCWSAGIKRPDSDQHARGTGPGAAVWAYVLPRGQDGHDDVDQWCGREGWVRTMHGWSITRRLFVAHSVFIVSLAVFVSTAAFVDARDRGYSERADRLLAVAAAIADSPFVVTAATSPDPTAALQPYTLEVNRDAALDFITIMSPAGVSWTHPDPAEIGRQYVGRTGPATAGMSFTDVTPGTPGPSVRAVVPILDSDGEVVGMVAAGVRTSNLQIALDARLPAILAITLTLLLAGSLATWVLRRYLRRVTLGWGPEELARLFVHNDSVVNSVPEGLILVDGAGDLVLYNDRAAELLGLPPRPASRAAGAFSPRIDDLDLPPSLADLLRSGRTVADEIHLCGSRVLVVSQNPAEPTPSRLGTRAAPVGTVATLRER
ncbi:PAS domain-containing protein [Cryobacterium sp. TMT4-31]|nr:PAS domain-containing protein [Cryobacterium sp. TMT4-31]